MSPIIDPTAVAWYAALTTAERADRWRARFSDQTGLGASDALDEHEARVAAWRMGQWATQSPFSDDPSLLARRFADLEVPSEAVKCVVGASPERLARWRRKEGDAESVWLTALTEYLNAPTCLPADHHNTAIVEGARDSLATPLTAPIAFLVRGASRRLVDAAAGMARRFARLPFSLDAIPALASNTLIEKLTSVASRMIALEIQVAGMSGMLKGDTPEQRARSFAERFESPSASAALFSEYPAAARLLAGQANQWLEATIELLERLCVDAPLLEDQLTSGEKLGTLTHLQSGVGDSHRKGRSVTILTFASGARIVYKPRSLAVDKAYGDLLAWVNSHRVCASLRPLRLLDCKTHGWMEHLTAAPCASSDAVARYYERLGAQLALLYLLDGTDMHRENVIAAGEHPCLIDLETLFHPDLQPFAQDRSSDVRAVSSEPQELLAGSVLKSGLLPFPVWTDDEGQSVDLSGIGGAGGQTMPGTQLILDGADTDSMRFSRARLPLAAAQNVPVDDIAVSDEVRAKAIDRGFAAVYALLLSKASVLTSATVLAPFENVPVRVVIRPTQTYGLVLRESLHPDFLRDGVDRDRFFDKLWVAVRVRPDLVPVIPAERLALQRGDVPVFHTTPQSRDLICDTWGTLSGFFAHTSLDRVAARIAALGPADEARQRWLIRASLASAARDPFAASELPEIDRMPLPRPTRAVEVSAPRTASQVTAQRLGTDLSDALLTAASEIGDRLAAQALAGRREVSWFSLIGRGAHDTAATLAGYDLHGGIPGILVFFRLLAEAESEARFEGLTDGAVTLLGRMLEDSAVVPEIGAFSGLGGVLYGLGALDPQRLTPEAVVASKAMRRIATLSERTRSWNVFGGLAGAIGALSAWAEATGDEEALSIAARCGVRMLDFARRDDFGLYWGDPQSCSSFAFGTSGVVWALARLGLLRQDSATIELADQAFGALAGRLEADSNRLAAPAIAVPSVYRGLPGIAIAAAAVRRAHGADDDSSRLALRLMRATLSSIRGSVPGASGRVHGRSDAPRSHALCNGTLGLVDVMLHCRTVDPGWDEALTPGTIERIGMTILRGTVRTGWQCGTPLSTEAPGLMNGLAGIGVGLLRLRAPASIPAIVAMALPETQIVRPERATPRTLC